MKTRLIIFNLIMVLLMACQPNAPQQSMGGMSPMIEQEMEEEPDIQMPVDEEPSAGAARIEEFFNNKAKSGFNGTVLFAEEGKISFTKAYGYSNMRSKDSLRIESAFQLASVSKPITALAILKLYDQHLLDLEDTVQQYFPEFPYPGITIRNLLSHRSGLPNYMYFSDEFWPNRDIAITNRDVLNIMAKYTPKPYYLPDQRYNYSNTNYAILALIVEEVSKTPFEAFVKLNIFLPLDMSNSLIYNKSAYPDNFNLVVGYTGSRREAENTYLNGVVGDKGVYTSALDLLKLDQALYNGSLISDSTLDKAFSLQHKDLRVWDNYGLGWRINANDPDNKVVYHTGWWRGFHTYFIRELGSKKTLIILSNTDRSSYMSMKDLLGLI